MTKNNHTNKLDNEANLRLQLSPIIFMCSPKTASSVTLRN